MKKCLHDTDCNWFTLEKEHDNCILYEECHDQFDCETCATGEKDCARGYHGRLIVHIAKGWTDCAAKLIAGITPPPETEKAAPVMELEEAAPVMELGEAAPVMELGEAAPVKLALV